MYEKWLKVYIFKRCFANECNCRNKEIIAEQKCVYMTFNHAIFIASSFHSWNIINYGKVLLLQKNYAKLLFVITKFLFGVTFSCDICHDGRNIIMFKDSNYNSRVRTIVQHIFVQILFAARYNISKELQPITG